MMKDYSVLIVTGLIFATAVSAGLQVGKAMLVVLDAETTDAMWEAVEKLSDEGYQTRIIFPPHFLFVAPKTNDPRALADRDYVVGVHTERISDETLYSRYENGETAVSAFNYVYFDDAGPKGEPPPNVHKPALFLIPEGVKEQIDFEKRAKAPPYGGTYTDTSEYMMGTASAQIVFPESTGNGENWTEARKTTCINEVTLALEWWTETYPEDDLSFIIHDDTASTTYEPIDTVFSLHDDWISECLDDLGYPGSNHWNQCYDLLNDIRDSDNTDWAYLIFIADSYNDSDGMFPDGYFAYAYLGGPYQVMTYDNDYWGINNMDIVCAHESGHIFYALDEYPGSPWVPYSGYLNVYNGNWNGSTPCIMNSSSLMFQAWNAHDNCQYTDEMCGWRDGDSNGKQDILDVEPETWLDEYLPDPTDEEIVTYTGTTQVQTYPNNNPFGNGNDIHIGFINAVKWKQNPPSNAFNATPTDGAFDSGEEDYTFTSKPLEVGENEFRAFCFVKWFAGYKARDLTPAVDFLTYDPDDTAVGDLDFAAEYHHPRNVQLTWKDPGMEYVGFNLYRGVSAAEGGIGSLTYGTKLNADVITGAPPFKYVDGGVELDVNYVYTLEAITPAGDVHTVTAEITPKTSIPGSYALYQNAPNPVVHGTSVITFALPEPCDVKLALYDVSGRKLSDILNRRLEAGYHEVAFEANLPAGVYIYRINAGDYSAAKKMVVNP